MAKQAGKIKIEGRTFGKLVFYKMGSEYYVRTKSSLTGKRVKKDPRFRSTMRSANLLGRASKIGSAAYKALPKEFRQFFMYRAFTGEAMMMLKKGMSEMDAQKELFRIYVDVQKPGEAKATKPQERKQINYTSPIFTPQALQLFLNNACEEILAEQIYHYKWLMLTEHMILPSAESP
jgi:hypothetical protein